MKKILTILPIIWLILGAVAIATEIKITDPLPAWQQLSGTVVTCITTALEKRETTIVSSVTTFQNNSSTALTTRKASLLAAWTKSTKSEIKTALSAAWKTYKSSMTTLKATVNTAKKTAWATYKTEVKACKGTTLLQSLDSSSLSSEQ